MFDYTPNIALINITFTPIIRKTILIFVFLGCRYRTFCTFKQIEVNVCMEGAWGGRGRSPRGSAIHARNVCNPHSFGRLTPLPMPFEIRSTSRVFASHVNRSTYIRTTHTNRSVKKRKFEKHTNSQKITLVLESPINSPTSFVTRCLAGGTCSRTRLTGERARFHSGSIDFRLRVSYDRVSDTLDRGFRIAVREVQTLKTPFHYDCDVTIRFNSNRVKTIRAAARFELKRKTVNNYGRAKPV